jgi:hypothetical protein
VSFAWTFTLLALTTYRVTRLLVVDNFPPLLWLRTRLTGDDETGERPAPWVPWWLEYLAGCYWCVSVWISGLLTLVVTLSSDLPYPLLVWGGVAALAPWLSHIEEYLTRRE